MTHFLSLKKALEEYSPFTMINVSDFCPDEPHQKYKYIQKIHEGGLSVPASISTYSAGGKVVNISVVWKMLYVSESKMIECLLLMEKFKESIPKYHTKI